MKGFFGIQPLAKASVNTTLRSGITSRMTPSSAWTCPSGPRISMQLRPPGRRRSEEHTSELQSLMRISYAVFCLKKKKINPHIPHETHNTILSKYTHNTYENEKH